MKRFLIVAGIGLVTMFGTLPAGAAPAPSGAVTAPDAPIEVVRGGHGRGHYGRGFRRHRGFGHHRGFRGRGLHRGWYIGRGNPHRYRRHRW